MHTQKKQGSILAYTLIILTVMMIVAIGISQSSMRDRQSAITSTKSTQSFQIADSGLQQVSSLINAHLSDKLNSSGINCINGSGSSPAYIQNSNLFGGSYKAYLYEDKMNPITNCSSKNGSDVGLVKVEATYGGTTRAVEVALAAGKSLSCVSKVKRINTPFTDDQEVEVTCDPGYTLTGCGDFTEWTLCSEGAVPDTGTNTCTAFADTSTYTMSNMCTTSGRWIEVHAVCCKI